MFLGLIYQGQPGALNEASSDVIAESVCYLNYYRLTCSDIILLQGTAAIWTSKHHPL